MVTFPLGSPRTSHWMHNQYEGPGVRMDDEKVWIRYPPRALRGGEREVIERQEALVYQMALGWLRRVLSVGLPAGLLVGPLVVLRVGRWYIYRREWEPLYLVRSLTEPSTSRPPYIC